MSCLSLIKVHLLTPIKQQHQQRTIEIIKKRIKRRERNIDSIEQATDKDIQGIIDVFNELHYANKTEDDKDKGGFLVYKPNEEELRETINNDSNIVLVAKDGKQVVGYALAYNLSEWKKDNPEWDANLDISNIDECLYFRHIARLPGYKKVGLKLEENTEELAREMGYSSVFADISEANQFSRKVHINRGYKNARETTKDDGSAWGTFVKPLYKGNQNLN